MTVAELDLLANLVAPPVTYPSGLTLYRRTDRNWTPAVAEHVAQCNLAASSCLLCAMILCLAGRPTTPPPPPPTATSTHA